MRYKKFMKDVRYSVSETLIRSIEAKKLQIHRKYPKSESLKDCMDRTIPYFIQQIEKEVNSITSLIYDVFIHFLQIAYKNKHYRPLKIEREY